ncbi:MAG: hypothetical protein ACTSPW_19170, partial [Promethearchaeota archaeon]
MAKLLTDFILTKIKDEKIAIILMFFAIISVWTLDYFSIIILFIFYFLYLFFFNIFFKNSKIAKATCVFSIYIIITVIIYWIQYLTFPEYHGFSGDLGFGTDDRYFYEEAVFGATYRGFRLNLHPYSLFLRGFVYLISIFKELHPIDLLFVNKELHPIDLLFVNVLGASFIPLFTKEVSYKISKNEKVSTISFFFTLFCPIIIVNSLILVKDGWTAALFIGSFYFLIERRYLFLILSIIFLLFLQISSGVLLIISLLIFIFFISNDKTIIINRSTKYFVSLFLLIITILALPYIFRFLEYYHLLENFLFREEYLNFLTLGANENSMAVKIYTQPFLIRLVLGFFFYFGSPFLSYNSLFYEGKIVARSLILFSFPFLFIFYFKYFIHSAYFSFLSKQKSVLVLFIIFILNILLLSQLSIQFRHKTMVMPLFYILVAI